MDPGGVTSATMDLLDLSISFLDAAGVLGATIVLVDVLVDPGGVKGATPDLLVLTNSLLEAAGVLALQGCPRRLPCCPHRSGHAQRAKINAKIAQNPGEKG